MSDEPCSSMAVLRTKSIGTIIALVIAISMPSYTRKWQHARPGLACPKGVSAPLNFGSLPSTKQTELLSMLTTAVFPLGVLACLTWWLKCKEQSINLLLEVPHAVYILIIVKLKLSLSFSPINLFVDIIELVVLIFLIQLKSNILA